MTEPAREALVEEDLAERLRLRAQADATGETLWTIQCDLDELVVALADGEPLARAGNPPPAAA